MSMDYTIRQVNRTIAALQIIAANAVHFDDGFTVMWNGVEIWYYGDDTKKQMANGIRALRRVTNGKVTKEYTDTHFTARIKHTLADGQEIEFLLRAGRNSVCTKVEKGTEMVEQIDYSNAPKIMVEKPVFEWVCDSILEGA